MPALLLGLLLAGCKGLPYELGETGGGLGPNGEDATRALEQRCDDRAAQRTLDAECWPTRHVGRWHGFVTGAAQYLHVLPSPLLYPSGDLLLEVDAQGSASLTFSAGDAGEVDAGTPCSSSGVLDSCTIAPGLVLGFPYDLEGLRMTGGPDEDRRRDTLMAFSLIIAEPWRARCAALAADAGPCACTREGCGVALASLQATLVLSADARALRGSARTERLTETVSAGWEFVRE